jgi:hypothetical protein
MTNTLMLAAASVPVNEAITPTIEKFKVPARDRAVSQSVL